MYWRNAQQVQVEGDGGAEEMPNDDEVPGPLTGEAALRTVAVLGAVSRDRTEGKHSHRRCGGSKVFKYISIFWLLLAAVCGCRLIHNMQETRDERARMLFTVHVLTLQSSQCHRPSVGFL